MSPLAAVVFKDKNSNENKKAELQKRVLPFCFQEGKCLKDYIFNLSSP